MVAYRGRVLYTDQSVVACGGRVLYTDQSMGINKVNAEAIRSGRNAKHGRMLRLAFKYFMARVFGFLYIVG